MESTRQVQETGTTEDVETLHWDRRAGDGLFMAEVTGVISWQTEMAESNS